MMTKDQILSQIRRLAKERGGHVSLRAFVDATGIPEKQVLGKHWARWNQALTEAGVAPASFLRPRVNEDFVIEAFARLAERLQKWPTQNELNLERRRDPSFPSLKVFRRLSNEGSLSQKLAAYCADRSDLATAAKVAAERNASEAPGSFVLGRAPVNGYVYMMRSGRRYKVGYTTSPSRRHREVRLDLPDPTNLVHAIPTDDPPGIEAYWHRRFQSKRVRDTEFFTLDASDVSAFKRRRYQ